MVCVLPILFFPVFPGGLPGYTFGFLPSNRLFPPYNVCGNYIRLGKCVPGPARPGGQLGDGGLSGQYRGVWGALSSGRAGAAAGGHTSKATNMEKLILTNFKTTLFKFMLQHH